MNGAAPRFRLLTPVILAISILMIVAGSRQSVGLLVSSIVATTTMNIAQVSMAAAVGQLFWGLLQPFCGALAGRIGTFRVIALGMLCLAAGQAGAMWASSPVALIVSMGILSSAGAAAGSMSIIMGGLAPRLPEKKRSSTTGLINAGESAGHFVFPPLVQFFINLRGYTGALGFLGAAALFAIVPAWFLFGKGFTAEERRPAAKTETPSAGKGEFAARIKAALRTPAYLMVMAEFFTCGFHVSLFSTHLPGEIKFYGFSPNVAAFCFSIIGICNIAGTIGSGILGKYIRLKYLLSCIYAMRVLWIAAYFFAPKTELTFYIFAVGIGFTWNATVPPTIGLVGKLFAGRYLATLFGVVYFAHQIGAFLGAWLGGVVIHQTGNLLWNWYIAAGLALFAALIVLPIREK
ncbi:MAG: MFS transporter [Spirochaetales bacterium]|jgi:predicted MFS family arabinose efflux permease|nr:MFS transporter [Spirochaetales bacterium]